jgi:hypothetical protein
MVTQQLLVADFLRAQAAWQLARSQHDPIRAARCAAALLDAAAYVAALAADDRNLAMLARAGCFRGQVFDPGPKGVSLARWWQYRDAAHAGPRDLIAALAVAVDSPAGEPLALGDHGGPAGTGGTA